ncbi:MAG: long-chain fatty acid--CoA ligase [Candidatus Bathyarchaeota archaeon]|nr:long-chain fatty acid--CoA ligase [Candidatus Bathyarchaeota archaeon]
MNDSKPWLKNWPHGVPKHIEYHTVPLHMLLHQAAKNQPKKTAITCGTQEITYSELDLLSNQFANALISRFGVQKGECVALYLPNVPQFVIAYFGALKTGAAVTAISPLHREREVEYQLRDSGAETIVTLDTLYPVVADVREKTQQKNIVISRIGEYGFFGDFQEGFPEEPPDVEVDSEDLAALQYTGGTTGTAKGAMLTHYNLVSNAQAFAAMIQAKSSDIFLTALPLFHIYGMTTSMATPISVAAKMVLMPKFEPAKVLESIQKHKVTVFCGVPTMYQYLLANPDLSKYNLKSIRACISGATSMPPQVQKQFMEVTGGFLAEGYGLTEASPVTHCNPVDKARLHVGSIGLPLPDTDAKIVDLETGKKTLAVGEVGELAVTGPQIMSCYWQKPTETSHVLRSGWLLTGDIARMDADGYFYIVDRKKDLIKHKGFSVYPRELEDVLYEHPAVKLCAVVGKADAEAGEVPKAFVVLKEGRAVLAEDLMTYVNTKVASYKAIREVEFRKELPLSAAGKVLRRQLKEQQN